MIKVFWCAMLYLVATTTFGQSGDSLKAAHQQFRSFVEKHHEWKDYRALDKENNFTIYKEVVKWAEVHGSVEDQLIGQLIQLYFTEDVGPTYERLVLGKRLWFRRSEFPVAYHPILCHQLEIIYRAAQMPKEALEVALVYHAIVKGLGEDRDWNLKSNIATIYYGLKQYDQALKYFREAQRICSTNEDQKNVAGMFNNIGSVYTDMLLNDSALIAFDQALDILKGIQDTSALDDKGFYDYYQAFVQWNRFKVSPIDTQSEVQKNRLANALIKLGPAYKDHYWAVVAYQYLGEQCYSRGEYEVAITHYDSAMTVGYLKPSVGVDVTIELIAHKARACLAAGYQDLADSLYRRWSFLSDSVEAANSEFEATVAAAQYESQEMEKRLQTSKLAAERAELERQREASQKLLIAVVAVLVALLALGLIVSLRKTAKDRKRITAQKEQLEIALRDKEMLIKEIHHRVKNNMQIMSGLFSLQSAHSNNSEFKVLAAEGQSRIDSMALVHQMLYNSSNLNDVDFKEYSTTLVRQLCSTMDQGKEVDVQLDIDTIPFDLDTAISLGLIINELVTNAFKYGLNQQGSTLRVSLKEQLSNNALLTIADSGPGYPEGFSVSATQSLGVKLVRLLAGELKADVKFFNNQGAHCTLQLKV